VSKCKYDFVIVGRFRNRDKVDQVKESLRAAGKSVYCFTDNEYDGHGIKFNKNEADVHKMVSATEALDDWQTNPTWRKIFETDMQGLQDSEKLVLVFPSGLAAHMELGVAYGLGKKCFAIGLPEKTETLYLMLDGIFPSAEALLKEVG
jgi:hypothetical protein